MNWAVFYTYPSGEQLCEVYPEWDKAHETLVGLIEMINPPRTEVTFMDLAKAAKDRPEKAFHATDGIHTFAIETTI
jgi:hypothetical protein